MARMVRSNELSGKRRNMHAGENGGCVLKQDGRGVSIRSVSYATFRVLKGSKLQRSIEKLNAWARGKCVGVKLALTTCDPGIMARSKGQQ
jgi:hypothetical protein